MTSFPSLSRRSLLGMGLAGAASLALPGQALAARGSYGLHMINANTDESFRLTMIENGRWVPEALAEFDWFARDWRRNSEYPIDVDSVMILIRTQQKLDCSEPMVMLSGYRTPQTNRDISGAASNSLHMRGLAVDITQPGRSLDQLHRAAVSLKAGGVGLYRSQHFVHVDSGRLRHWNG